MPADKKFVIGIDIGGSKINAVLMTPAGEIFHRVKIPMLKNKREFLEKLYAAVGHLVSAAGKKNILGIGCGVGGALDLEKGIVLSWSNVKFLDGFNVKNWLKKKFNREVKINNDAQCFTRGEYLFGSGRGYKNIIGMTLGTGVGGGIVVNGKMVYGNGAAGEIGHMVINSSKDLETLTVKHLRKVGISSIKDAYQSRDKKVKEELKNFETCLGIAFANIINILDPEAIILGGGAAEAAKIFIPKIRKTMERFIVSPKSLKNVKILMGNLGDNAGAIGAAALFME